ncbi:N6-adenosine-methyltransferase TMT1A-like [Daphnia carinata]|uniref:N6-adenosine-methyltransferase TMT1A-like n=1 Tax=Daphnia carinata TaxID=120202 RepID=UPI00258068FA|nr:N6-adenosine-methyltransferase TMT1A-like [Daphnia carinata]
MSNFLTEIFQVLQPWIPHLLPVSIVLFVFQKFGGSHIQPWFFSKVYSPLLSDYHVKYRSIKKEHFDSMKNHVSADLALRKKGALRILEIGPGPGYNFEFYPANSELTVVEVNPFFEEQFFKKQVEHPYIIMDRFVVGYAENMKDVPDNSVDVVVSTIMLCSVRSIEGALQEIRRVLVPGGKYYYWEHIRDYDNFWVRFVQNLLSYTTHDLVFGCRLNRKTDEVIKANKCGFSSVEQKRFRTPLQPGFGQLRVIHSAHVKGIATK